MRANRGAHAGDGHQKGHSVAHSLGGKSHISSSLGPRVPLRTPMDSLRFTLRQSLPRSVAYDVPDRRNRGQQDSAMTNQGEDEAYDPSCSWVLDFINDKRCLALCCTWQVKKGAYKQTRGGSDMICLRPHQGGSLCTH